MFKLKQLFSTKEGWFKKRVTEEKDYELVQLPKPPPASSKDHYMFKAPSRPDLERPSDIGRLLSISGFGPETADPSRNGSIAETPLNEDMDHSVQLNDLTAAAIMGQNDNDSIGTVAGPSCGQPFTGSIHVRDIAGSSQAANIRTDRSSSQFRQNLTRSIPAESLNKPMPPLPHERVRVDVSHPPKRTLFNRSGNQPRFPLPNLRPLRQHRPQVSRPLEISGPQISRPIHPPQSPQAFGPLLVGTEEERRERVERLQGGFTAGRADEMAARIAKAQAEFEAISARASAIKPSRGRRFLAKITRFGGKQAPTKELSSKRGKPEDVSNFERVTSKEYGRGITFKEAIGRRVNEGRNLSRSKVQQLTGDGKVPRKPVSTETFGPPPPQPEDGRRDPRLEWPFHDCLSTGSDILSEDSMQESAVDDQDLARTTDNMAARQKSSDKEGPGGTEDDKLKEYYSSLPDRGTYRYTNSFSGLAQHQNTTHFATAPGGSSSSALRVPSSEPDSNTRVQRFSRPAAGAPSPYVEHLRREHLMTGPEPFSMNTTRSAFQSKESDGNSKTENTHGRLKPSLTTSPSFSNLEQEESAFGAVEVDASLRRRSREFLSRLSWPPKDPNAQQTLDKGKGKMADGVPSRRKRLSMDIDELELGFKPYREPRTSGLRPLE